MIFLTISGELTKHHNMIFKCNKIKFNWIINEFKRIEPCVWHVVCHVGSTAVYTENLGMGINRAYVEDM